MTTKFQRGVLWGALFLFALLGGSFLGRFVVGGLAGGKMLADNAAANFWEQQDKAHNASAMSPANVAVAPSESGAHVCEGCDASSLRLRQPGNEAFHYDPQAPDGAGSAPPPPAATAHP